MATTTRINTLCDQMNEVTLMSSTRDRVSSRTKKTRKQMELSPEQTLAREVRRAARLADIADRSSHIYYDEERKCNVTIDPHDDYPVMWAQSNDMTRTQRLNNIKEYRKEKFFEDQKKEKREKVIRQPHIYFDFDRGYKVSIDLVKDYPCDYDRTDFRINRETRIERIREYRHEQFVLEVERRKKGAFSRSEFVQSKERLVCQSSDVMFPDEPSELKCRFVPEEEKNETLFCQMGGHSKMRRSVQDNINRPLMENFNYSAYHPTVRKNLIAKDLYTEYCIYFYSGRFGECVDIINHSHRLRREEARIKDKTRSKGKKAKQERMLCEMFRAYNNLTSVASDVADTDLVSRTSDTVENVNNLVNDIGQNDLVGRAANIATNVELLCSKASSAIDKATQIFDLVQSSLTPSEGMLRKAVIIAGVSKLFASAEFSITNLFCYFATVCATFDVSSNMFSSVYAKFQSSASDFVMSHVCQSGDGEESEVTERFTLLSSIAHTFSTIFGFGLSVREIGKAMADIGRAMTGGEKIYSLLNKVFSWVRNKYFEYRHGISYDKYQVQVKFPELAKLAKCCILIGKVTNAEIDSTSSLCRVILETDKLAHEMSMCTLKESESARYIQMLRTSIKPFVNRAQCSPVMADSVRSRPFAIYLHGLAGTGKTNLTDLIKAHLFKKYFADSYAPGYDFCSFSRKTENEFWEGYTGQPFCVYDDIFQLNDSRDKPNPEIMELIRIINEDLYQLHMAELSSKSGTFFKSPFVLCTSNTKKPACKSITCPEAIHRRFDVCIDVHVEPKYALTLKDASGNAYCGIDRKLCKSVVDEDVYILSTYDMNSTNMSNVLKKFDPKDGKSSFTLLMEHIYELVDEHNNLNTDRENLLREIAGQRKVGSDCSGKLKAKEIFKEQQLVPSNASVKAMQGGAPFPVENLQTQSGGITLGPNGVMECLDKDITHEEIVDISKIDDSWRDRIDSLCRKTSDIFSDLCSKVGNSFSGNILEFPELKISERYAEFEKFMAEWKKTFTGRFKEFVDKAFEYKATILTGVLSVVGLALYGTKAMNFVKNTWKGCPLGRCEKIEDILEESTCNCESCSFLRPYLSRVDEFDSQRSMSLYLFSALSAAVKDKAKIAKLQVLVNAESAMSNVRENDASRKKRIAVAHNITNPSQVDSRSIAELSSGDSHTSRKSTVRIAEIESGSNVTHRKNTSLITENFDSEIAEALGMANKQEDLLEVIDSQEKNRSYLSKLFFGNGKGNAQGADKKELKCQSSYGKDQAFQEQFNRFVARNAVWVSVSRNHETIPGLVGSCGVTGVFIQGRVMAIPHHMYAEIKKTAGQRFWIQYPFREVSSVFTLDECEVQQLKGRDGEVIDCVFMAMPLRVPSYPSLVNNFANASELELIEEGDMILAGLRMYKKGHLILSHHHITDAYLSTQMDHEMPDGSLKYRTASSISYSAATKAGDCGSLLFARGTPMRGRITGMHVAGGRTTGMALALSKELIVREMIRFAKSVGDDRIFVKGSFSTSTCQLSKSQWDYVVVDPVLSQSVLNVEGDYLSVGLAKKLPRPIKTNLNPSLFHNKIYETPSKPAYLREVTINGKKVDPLKKGICKSFTTQVQLDCSILKIASNDVFAQFKPTKGDVRRVITYEEALQGVEGNQYMCGVNRGTSAGFPWVYNHKLSGKKDWLGATEEWDLTNEELRNAVDRIISKAKLNQRSDIVFIASLKDERRPKEKVEQGKTRVFDAGPMDYTIALRKYTLGFVESVMRNRIDNEVCVGVNVYSNDWNRLALKMRKKGKHCIAGDFSGYDGSLHQQILWEVCNIMNRWYDDGDTNKRIRNVLFEEIVNSVIMVDGVLLQRTHSQPSGNPLTVIINSLFNQIVMRMSYLLAKKERGMSLMCDFTDYVSMATYGDDNLINISAEIIDWYNQVSITKHLATCGLTYTDETKSGKCVPYRTLGEVNFLKRGFVKNESGIYVAPLAIETIRDMTNWVRGKHIRLATQENVGCALMEFALHGKEVYEDENGKIGKVAKQTKLQIRVPVYEELESFFAMQRNQ